MANKIKQTNLESFLKNPTADASQALFINYAISENMQVLWGNMWNIRMNPVSRWLPWRLSSLFMEQTWRGAQSATP